MTESEWKELVEMYSREAAEEFQKTVNAYYEKKSAAQAQKDSAESAIGEEQKPVLEEIQKEREAAETEYQEKEKIYNQLRMDNRDDREVFDALSGRLEERKTIVEEHARIDTLYRMTSGNVSGARMDLKLMYSGIIWNIFYTRRIDAFRKCLPDSLNFVCMIWKKLVKERTEGLI